MRKFLKGRRRYALLVLVGVGSLAIMGAECQPEPVKPPPPTGLSIEPTSHDFGNQAVGAGQTAATTFTVTNHGPAMDPHTLVVTVIEGDVEEFTRFGSGVGSCLSGVSLGVGETCTVNALFDPATTGPKQARVGVRALGTGDPTAWTTLTGTGTR